VPGADDIMLNYQSTSFHDALFLREITGLRRAPEFEAWLQRQHITTLNGQLLDSGAGLQLINGLQALTEEEEAA
jgi:ethanolamine ammonia-lyase large subunit